MKILILRFSSIGDIVLTSPVIRCLKQQLPGAKIHYLTKQQFAPVLEHNPYVDTLHTLQQNWLQQALSLKKEGFDCIIDLHHNLRSSLISTIIGAPRYAFNKANIAKWLLVKFKIDRLPKQHIVNRYLQATSGLGIVDDGNGLDYYLPPEIENNLPNLPQSYIAVAIGAQHFTKRMPIQKWVDLFANLKSTSFILLGGKEDVRAANEIITATGSHVQSYCGKLSLHQSAAIVKNAQHVITHDTGLMHIAAAFQKPISSIWGNTIPGLGMYPYFGKLHKGTSYMHEVSNLNCRPCSKIGFNRCPRQHFDCMQKQDLVAIAKSLPIT